MNNIYIFYKKDSNSGLMYILSSPPFRKTQQVFILYHRTGKLKKLLKRPCATNKQNFYHYITCFYSILDAHPCITNKRHWC